MAALRRAGAVRWRCLDPWWARGCWGGSSSLKQMCSCGASAPLKSRAGRRAGLRIGASPGPWAARTQTPRHGGASPRGVRQAPGPPLTTAGVQARERGPTYLSSAVRMTSTPYPANCASCRELLFSVSCAGDKKALVTEALNSARHRRPGPARHCPPAPPPRPPGHLLLPLPPYHLAKGLSPLAQAGRAASLILLPGLLTWDSPPLGRGSLAGPRGEVLIGLSSGNTNIGGEWGGARAIQGQSQTPGSQRRGGLQARCSLLALLPEGWEAMA